MTFDELLSELVGLNGSRIDITVGGREEEPNIAIAASGALLLGIETTGSVPGSAFERYFFAFEGAPGSGFFLDRSRFRGGTRSGQGLRIEMGAVIIRVTPSPD